MVHKVKSYHKKVKFLQESDKNDDTFSIASTLKSGDEDMKKIRNFYHLMMNLSKRLIMIQ